MYSAPIHFKIHIQNLKLYSYLSVSITEHLTTSISVGSGRSKLVIINDKLLYFMIQVTVMSPTDGSLSYAGQTSADSVQMNPTQPLIALKGR